MSRSVGVVLGVVGAVLLVLVIVLGVKYKQTTTRYAATRESEESIRNQFNSALESIAEIQDSLNAVMPVEERVVRLSESAETGGPLTQTQKEQMLGTIDDLKRSIESTRNRIRDLEGSIKSGQAEVAGLRRIIDNLKRTAEQREAMVQRLSARVDALTVQVAGLEATVRRGREQIAEQRNVIAEKSRELSTVFYIVGTKDDLKKKGIVTEEGGVIGIGKAATVSGTFNESDFTLLDTDESTSIPIQGKEPQVLSSQSKSSYRLETGGGVSNLVITDPQEFRKVRYLVVLVED